MMYSIGIAVPNMRQITMNLPESWRREQSAGQPARREPYRRAHAQARWVAWSVAWQRKAR